MKFIVILCILFTNILIGQKKYPHLDKDSNGVILVVLTEEQARKLDNISEFTHKDIIDKESYIKFSDSLCTIKTTKIYQRVKELEESLDYSQKNYNSLMTIKINDEMSLNHKIKDLENVNINSQTIIKNYEILISENNKKIKLYNKHVNVAIGFGLAAFVGAFIASF